MFTGLAQMCWSRRPVSIQEYENLGNEFSMKVDLPLCMVWDDLRKLEPMIRRLGEPDWLDDLKESLWEAINRAQDLQMCDIGMQVYNVELCPGCGCAPGDGLTENCTDENGCGYWRELGHNDA